MNFKVLNEEIYFPKDFVNLNEIRIKFFNIALDSIDKFNDLYDENFKNTESLATKGKEFGVDFLSEYISTAVDIINRFEVENIDKNKFLQEYYLNKYWIWGNKIDDLSKESLKHEESSQEEGIKNKEVILNENENIRLNIKSELIKVNKNINEYTGYMVDSIFNIHFAIIDFLRDSEVKEIASYNDVSNVNKANILMDAILHGHASDEDKAKIVKEIITLNPYNDEVFKVLLDKYGDRDNEIEAIGEFLGFNNIRQYKYEMLDKYFITLPIKTKKDIVSSRANIESYAINISLDNYDSYLKSLDNIVIEEEAAVEAVGDFASVQSEDAKIKERGKERSKVKKVQLISAVIAGSLVVVYFIIALYFNSHIFFRSTINGVNISGKSLKGANDHMASIAENYVLSFELRDNDTEEIKGSEISLKYDFRDKINEIIKEQNPFLWINSLFKEKNYEIVDNITYDEILLKQELGNLAFMNSENMQQPVNAYFNLVDGNLELVPEVMGNKVKQEEFYNDVLKSINGAKSILSLDEENCYENPLYTTETEVVVNAKKVIDTYLASNIAYNYNDAQEVIDNKIIAPWINVNEEFNVSLNENSVREYVDSLGSIYDNIGETRTFTRWSGEQIKVSTTPGISYIDRVGTVSEIVEAVTSGSEQVKDLSFKTPDQLDDYVINTFVEVDLSNQTVVYYKNGQLITQGNIVTGNVSDGNATPPGVFRLDWKASPFVLRGADYESPVTFWMPFNGGIGLHDASWRSSFGGYIYKTNGSHGCVNMPYSVAQAIYNNIEDKTTIICRY